MLRRLALCLVIAGVVGALLELWWTSSRDRTESPAEKGASR